MLQKAVAAGAIVGDYGQWNILRAEAGLPLYGIDIDESTTLPELGERGISYDKGCYIGQEVVAKIKYIGHVNRRFTGFLCEGERVPKAPCIVRSSGKDAGTITTAVLSTALGKPIALGFVSRAAAVPGNSVEVVDNEGVIAAKVTVLPFVPNLRAD
jgi:aminomethyltransferase